jgi:hypothetical protein
MEAVKNRFTDTERLYDPEGFSFSEFFSGSALKYVPKELKTPELCLEAVKQNGSALEFVPDEYIDVCRAVSKGEQDG